MRSTLEQTNLETEEIQGIIRSFGIVSANITLRTDVTDDHIVDTLAGNRVYSDAVVILNKIDLASKAEIDETCEQLPIGWPVLPVSALTGEGIEAMKDFIFDNLHFMSIYLKPQGQEADLIEPLIVKNTSTVRDVCVKLHRDFVRRFRYARVKGPSAKFDWQRVGLDVGRDQERSGRGDGLGGAVAGTGVEREGHGGAEERGTQRTHVGSAIPRVTAPLAPSAAPQARLGAELDKEATGASPAV